MCTLMILLSVANSAVSNFSDCLLLTILVESEKEVEKLKY